MDDFFQRTLLGNTYSEWGTFLLVILVGGGLIWVIQRVIGNRLKKALKGKQGTERDVFEFIREIVQYVLAPLAFLAVFYYSLDALNLPGEVDVIIKKGSFILLVFLGVRALTHFIENRLLDTWTGDDEEEESTLQSYRGVIFLFKLVIWAAAFLFVLDNFGWDITAMIAGLGIGGIAIALGAQSVIGDLLSYFSILFDKPFKVNDFLIIDEHLGTVETIGIKTTRIRSLSGEMLVFSNSDLTSARIKNYGELLERRVVFHIGVIFDTSQEDVKRIPDLLRATVETIENTRFDRAHFKAFGDHSLIFETVYYVLLPEYATFMDIQQKINLEVKRKFEEEGIKIAYPSQTLFVHKIE